MGILTLVGDLLKGAIPVVIAIQWGESDLWIAMSGLTPFLGHIFPIFLGFKGGKGVATALGVYHNGGDEQLGKDIAMHIAAANPLFLSRETVDAAAVARGRSVCEAQAKETGKPDNVIAKIVDGKMEKYYGENCLLEQIYKDPDGKQKVKNILKGASVKRFVRMQLGEGSRRRRPTSPRK